jgi:hypothetical protein
MSYNTTSYVVEVEVCFLVATLHDNKCPEVPEAMKAIFYAEAGLTVRSLSVELKKSTSSWP